MHPVARRSMEVEKVAPMYNGIIHGTDIADIMDIEFPDMVHASMFVRCMAWEDRAEISSDENGVSVTAFNKPVVVQVQLGAIYNG